MLLPLCLVTCQVFTLLPSVFSAIHCNVWHLSDGNQNVGGEDEKQSLGARCRVNGIPTLLARVLDVGIHIARMLASKIIDSCFSTNWCLEPWRA